MHAHVHTVHYTYCALYSATCHVVYLVHVRAHVHIGMTASLRQPHYVIYSASATCHVHSCVYVHLHLHVHVCNMCLRYVRHPCNFRTRIGYVCVRGRVGGAGVEGVIVIWPVPGRVSFLQFEGAWFYFWFDFLFLTDMIVWLHKQWDACRYSFIFIHISDLVLLQTHITHWNIYVSACMHHSDTCIHTYMHDVYTHYTQ